MTITQAPRLTNTQSTSSLWWTPKDTMIREQVMLWNSFFSQPYFVGEDITCVDPRNVCTHKMRTEFWCSSAVWANHRWDTNLPLLFNKYRSWKYCFHMPLICFNYWFEFDVCRFYLVILWPCRVQGVAVIFRILAFGCTRWNYWMHSYEISFPVKFF